MSERGSQIEGLSHIDKFKAGLQLAPEELSEAADEIVQHCEDKIVANHEIGHSLVAEALGWKTKSISIVPGPGYRGVTEAVPAQNKSFDDLALEFAAICFGGAVAAHMMNDEVKGHGSDMSKARSIANMVAGRNGSKYQTPEQFLTAAQNLAHSALSSFGSSSIHRQAQSLSEYKIAA